MAETKEPLFLRDDLLGFLAIFLLFLGIMFAIAQLPAVYARQAQFSGWLYVFPILGFVLGIKSKRDAAAWAAILHFSMLFLIDVVYGVGAI